MPSCLPVFGKDRIGMFELTGVVGKHLHTRARPERRCRARAHRLSPGCMRRTRNAGSMPVCVAARRPVLNVRPKEWFAWNWPP